MKRTLLILLAFLPLLSTAELSVICRPSTIFLEPDQELKVLIHIKNDGAEPALVPWSSIQTKDIIKPDWYLFSLKAVVFTHDEVDIRRISGGWTTPGGGFICGENCIPFKNRKLATFIEPEETLVYELTYTLKSPKKTPSKPIDMYTLTFEFPGLDISIPPITLLPLEQKNPELKDAIQAAADLHVGMSDIAAYAVMAKHGIKPAGMMGGSIAWCSTAVLSDKSELVLDLRYDSMELGPKGPSTLTGWRVYNPSRKLIPEHSLYEPPVKKNGEPVK